ncbi:hypothetical protein [Nonomuraea sp. NPDC001023]
MKITLRDVELTVRETGAGHPVGHRIHSLAPGAFAAEVLPYLCGG